MDRGCGLLVILFRKQHERAELMQNGVVGALDDRLVGDIQSGVIVVQTERSHRVVELGVSCIGRTLHNRRRIDVRNAIG